MNFGPHAGHFRALAGENILDQIRYAHDQGFTAWKDNRAPRRPVDEQKAIRKLLAQLGMTMGFFVLRRFSESHFYRASIELG